MIFDASFRKFGHIHFLWTTHLTQLKISASGPRVLAIPISRAGIFVRSAKRRLSTRQDHSFHPTSGTGVARTTKNVSDIARISKLRSRFRIMNTNTLMQCSLRNSPPQGTRLSCHSRSGSVRLMRSTLCISSRERPQSPTRFTPTCGNSTSESPRQKRITS